jgi:Na+-driven multidrug efflux pump
MVKSTTRDMTTGSIWKNLFWFSLPLLFGNLFQQFYSTVDSLVVGNFVGADALGAVTSMMPAINTLIGLFIGVSTGASVTISQHFGAHNPEMVKKAVHTSLLGTFFLSLGFVVVGTFGAPYMVRFMQTAPSISPLATDYLKILFAGSTSTMMYNMGPQFCVPWGIPSARYIF